jgi:hypothetical protein
MIEELYGTPGSQLPMWCGSNYDAKGNARFDADTAGLENFIEAMGWGFINFDNGGLSLLTVFQIMAGDGWSDLMYMISDATDPVAAAIFCVSLIMLGTFFILQLIIATLENTLVAQEELKGAEDAAKVSCNSVVVVE